MRTMNRHPYTRRRFQIVREARRRQQAVRRTAVSSRPVTMDIRDDVDAGHAGSDACEITREDPSAMILL
jgi:hypothetical protein